jgi:hypothetical protein
MMITSAGRQELEDHVFSIGTDYQAGSVIEYVAYGNVTRQVEVTSVDPDIKNGREGFDGVVTSRPDAGLPVWGYSSQVTRVITK